MASNADEDAAAGLGTLLHGPTNGRDIGSRKIVLFSDGTGNSSAKVQRTNVWRLYEALDLGYPVESNNSVQLAYYDDGVGTSSIKLLAALGGAFGFGLVRNVRDIYKFLCRNYREGDEIYAFGFSRGAFTIRLLVAFIAQMGLVPYHRDNPNEANLDLATRDNWREFRRGFHSNNLVADFLVGLYRWLVRCVVSGKRRLFGQLAYAECVRAKRGNWLEEWRNAHRARKANRAGGGKIEDLHLPVAAAIGPDIEFVGVWDTVAAYGGPSIEIIRAIDEWIWPLSMPDYKLSGKVKCARHALSIDDKRDAFMPLLWDEVHEQTLPDFDKDKPRLQQVWFSGMHSDVGGGYSDDSLAYVSLWWMIEHAEMSGKGIRLLPFLKERIETFRNIYGTIHDSRGGAGMSYRYQIRNIDAWVNQQAMPVATQTFRDPTIDFGRHRHQGLLTRPIRIHRSVHERLQMATDGYSPNNLPMGYMVDDGVRGNSGMTLHTIPDSEAATLRACVDRIAGHIKLRRFWYFVSVLLFAAIVLKPWWPFIAGFESLVITGDSRNNTHGLEAVANAFLPEFARLWTSSLAATPFVSLVAVGLLALTSALGLGQERGMADIAGRMWRQRLDPDQKISAPETPGLRDRLLLVAARPFYTSDSLGAFLGWLKWRAVPKILGFIMWLGCWYVASILFVQALLFFTEAGHGGVCDLPIGRASASAAATASDRLLISAPCADTGLKVRSVSHGDPHEKRYRVGIEMNPASKEAWFDESQKATPEGWSDKHWRSKLVQWAVLPLQRVTTANLMQPVFEIRNPGWLFDDIYMVRPELRLFVSGRKNEDGTVIGSPCVNPDSSGTLVGERCWEGEITIPRQRSGAGVNRALYWFVNDVVLPIDATGPRWQLKPFDNNQRSVACRPELDLGFMEKLRSLRLFDVRGRYRNNCGEARITLTEVQ